MSQPDCDLVLGPALIGLPLLRRLRAVSKRWEARHGACVRSAAHVEGILRAREAAMISVADLIGFCDLTPDEVEAIAEHEHISDAAAVVLGSCTGS